MSYWVYILASGRGGTLYVGVTNDLIRRTAEHREGLVPGFTKKHNVKMLVYYEAHDAVLAAIQREKNIKHWPREWKTDLILSINSDWRDLRLQTAFNVAENTDADCLRLCRLSVLTPPASSPGSACG